MNEWLDEQEWAPYSPLLAFSILFHLLLLWMLLQISLASTPEERPPSLSPKVTIYLGELGDQGDGIQEGEEAEEDQEEAEEHTEEESQQEEETPVPTENPEEVVEESETTNEPSSSPETLLNASPALGVGPSQKLQQKFQSLLKKSIAPSQTASASSNLKADQAFAMRSKKGRADGVTRNGGSGATEDAVELSLAWLAEHQNLDGSWTPTTFNQGCECTGNGYDTYVPALTGLVLLCYSGAGYTHKTGPYRRQVSKGLDYLIQQSQQPNGRFAAKNMYNHAIAHLAMAEHYALSKDPQLKRPLEKAVAFCLLSQQEGGGWSYSATPETQRNDSSITGFMLMALITTHLSDVEVPSILFQKIARRFSQMTDSDGTVLYADTGTNAGRTGMGLVAVGLYARLALGLSPDSNLSKTQATRLLAQLPDWQMANTLSNSMYYWYYGTLATFMMGPDTFRPWNKRLSKILVAKQRRSGHEKGSYDPVGKWGKHGGRLYATAINTLTLEIYYKYAPQYIAQLSQFKSFWEKEQKKKPWEREVFGRK
ncbi:MAG: terpene cyclase/mutase family protein [Simkania sp.]|nr:terpene cyclase/mutase family protein [Simkania sp.]